MWRKGFKFTIFGILLLLGLLVVIQSPVLAQVTDTYHFDPDCYGPGGATTMGMVGPGVFTVGYGGSSTWVDSFYCNDFLGCLYMVRQPLAAGHYISVAVWGSATAVDIWTGWCG